MKKIKLTQGKYALVDDRDFDFLNQWKWFCHSRSGNHYVTRNLYNKKNKTQKQIHMHRLIMNTPKDKIIDHIDGNGLNNQRKNLRICTQIENIKNQGKKSNNTSGFKGISLRKDTNKYRVRINVDNKCINLGNYTSKLKAYEVYCEACIKYHGEFANVT